MTDFVTHIFGKGIQYISFRTPKSIEIKFHENPQKEALIEKTKSKWMLLF
jgi:hypothetical protein